MMRDRRDENLTWRQVVALAWPALAALGLLVVGGIAEKGSILDRIIVGPSGIYLVFWILGVFVVGTIVSRGWLKADTTRGGRDDR